MLGCAAALVLVVIVRGRSWGRKPWMQALSRLGLTALFTTLALVGALFNNEYAFYTSWGDLLGDSPEDTPRHYGAPTPAPALDQQAPSASATPTAPTTPQALPALPQPGQRLQKYEIPGPKNAEGRPTASRKVYVQLPVGYDPHSATRHPVIVAMHGLPGSPESYSKLDHFYTRLDKAVSDRRVAAPIVVVPQLNRTPDDDTECIDNPHGLQTETWLASTLPTWVRHTFAVAPGRGSWATWGYSLGGWCASMLTMKHPATFGAAVAYQGYFRPQFDGHPPFAPNSPQARSYDLIALEKANPVPVSLWLFASDADKVSYPSVKEFLTVVKRPTDVTARIAQGGGHRLSVWTRKIPRSFDWLAQVQPGFAPSSTFHPQGKSRLVDGSS
ncbi:alpha/beta hydrolase [Dermacoccus nishinomiyaensis]|uniref:alpha/beta hydrolase n=1 Tax=Dermacoccus nishinomiyaensis TaxID=1274 RepID=UPI00093F9471|nr:alpha/beta hydrolase-fold protein [Dermacoccus nishinomiyaensis]